MATTSKSTTVGLNVKGIDKMVDSINKYQSSIKKHCDLSAKNSLIHSAIQGTKSEATLKTMLNEINTKLENYISELNQYETILNGLKAEYVKNDSGNATFTTISNKL